MQTLIPESASATARPIGRTGRWAGFGLTPLAVWLLVGGLVLAVPAFYQPRRIWIMFAWDALALLMALVDAIGLPAPRGVQVTRTFLDSAEIGEATRIELSVVQPSNAVLDVKVAYAKPLLVIALVFFGLALFFSGLFR